MLRIAAGADERPSRQTMAHTTISQCQQTSPAGAQRRRCGRPHCRIVGSATRLGRAVLGRAWGCLGVGHPGELEHGAPSGIVGVQRSSAFFDRARPANSMHTNADTIPRSFAFECSGRVPACPLRVEHGAKKSRNCPRKPTAKCLGRPGWIAPGSPFQAEHMSHGADKGRVNMWPAKGRLRSTQRRLAQHQRPDWLQHACCQGVGPVGAAGAALPAAPAPSRCGSSSKIAVEHRCRTSNADSRMPALGSCVRAGPHEWTESKPHVHRTPQPAKKPHHTVTPPR